jgi:Holliday junction resolvase-like predicted endonuclease/energy-coupling factor transporter ATP-binding protein EcfA2
MRILVAAGEGTNARGDLFTDRMRDFVHAMGFEAVRTNIHKPGREIDVIARHRVEGTRYAVVECKAQQAKVGGGDVNKFVGVLDAERARYGDAVGYFVSLSGFKDSAIEQEEAAGGRRCFLIGPTQIIDELVKGRVVVEPHIAAYSAGALRGRSDSLKPHGTPDLVAHESGWLWAVTLGSGRARDSIALIHADGSPLDLETAVRVLAAIPSEYKGLRLLNPPISEAKPDTTAKKNYLNYLLSEYGALTHEGMPADIETGSTRMRLEDLYVPLLVEEWIPAEDTPVAAIDAPRPESDATGNPLHISEALAQFAHVAILGAPGAGKSTLIKRLAVAYADKKRRQAIADNLPDFDWLPLVVRCRDVNGGSQSILDILHSLPSDAELPQDVEGFTRLVDESLRVGSVLLLVDGLDEIAHPGARTKFVHQLRTFLTVYPLVRLVVTSREPGFRAVSGPLSEYCHVFKIGDLTDLEIRDLVMSWHRVVGSVAGRFDEEKAIALAHSIIGTDRVRRLAVNPLLLTTLLLVERWIGDLPRHRSVLYGKAIEVLLMTWNVEGHDPLALEEVRPQLGYLAFTMTSRGLQRVSADEACEILSEARSEMPDVLDFVRDSPEATITSIESRSSLLVQAGHVIESGTLQPAYEFKHLTFQEYLSALAITKEWLPSALAEKPIEDVLESHLGDEDWAEVCALTAILAGRKAGPLIDVLCSRLEDASQPYDATRNVADVLLACLADDVQVKPEIAERAINVMVDTSVVMVEEIVESLDGSRYFDELERITFDRLRGPWRHELHDYVNMSGKLLRQRLAGASKPEMMANFAAQLQSDDRAEVISILALIMLVAFSPRELPGYRDDEPDFLGFDSAEILQNVLPDVIAKFVNTEEPPGVTYAAAWALCWLARAVPFTGEDTRAITTRAVALVLDEDRPVSHFASWLLWVAARIPREEFRIELEPDQAATIASTLGGPPKAAFDHWWRSAAVVNFYARGPLTDDELAERLQLWGADDIEAYLWILRGLSHGK